MTELSSAIEAACQAMRDPPVRLEDMPDRTAPLTVPALRRVIEFGSGATAADRTLGVARLSEAIRVADVYQASRLAILAGTLVEWGADSRALAAAVLARLPGQIEAARRLAVRLSDEVGVQPGQAAAWQIAGLFESHPGEVRAWQGLRSMVLAAMTTLARSAEDRIAARREGALLEGVAALARHREECHYLSELLGAVDGLEILVLVPGQTKGFRVALEAVRNNFHLFTLLQGTLHGSHVPGPSLDPELLAVARGEEEPQVGLSARAAWDYRDAFGRTVPGEDRPTSIPSREGERVLVLETLSGPGRGWHVDFFLPLHPDLRAAVRVVETLGDGSVSSWMDRLRT